jgi:NADPH:quinone reductase-like Zn-dependent oxidoreductase
MRAIVYTEYGPPEVLRLTEVARPAPMADQVLLRIHAASVNPREWHFMRGTPYVVRIMTGWRHPKIPGLGVDVAGVVEAVGGNVTQFKPGDEVFGACRGAFAEFGCAAEGALVLKPAGVTYEQAAAVPTAGLTALQALRDKGQIKPGQQVLINGAAGGVGTFAVQLAKVFGAVVTGVCSTRNVDLVRSIGADQVVDYAREDFTRSGQRYDLILDTVGNHSLSETRRALTANGVLVLVGAPDKGRWLGATTEMIKAGVLSRFVRQRLHPVLTRLSRADFIVMGELLETGKVTPVIDRTYPLSDVSVAMRYLEEGHARGKVIIRIEHLRDT